MSKRYVSIIGTPLKNPAFRGNKNLVSIIRVPIEVRTKNREWYGVDVSYEFKEQFGIQWNSDWRVIR